MTGWIAVVPLRGRGERKTRLAGQLSPEQRHALSQAMFHHVVQTAQATPGVAEVVVLCDRRPDGWDGRLIHDTGQGLNAELAACTAAPLLVIHADLPLVTPDDIVALLTASDETGCAIAPDRHGTGTNALALRVAHGFGFAFGPDSCALHMQAAKGRARLVIRPGLGVDIDTPEDLEIAKARGSAPGPRWG